MKNEQHSNHSSALNSTLNFVYRNSATETHVEKILTYPPQVKMPVWLYRNNGEMNNLDDEYGNTDLHIEMVNGEAAKVIHLNAPPITLPLPQRVCTVCGGAVEDDRCLVCWTVADHLLCYEALSPMSPYSLSRQYSYPDTNSPLNTTRDDWERHGLDCTCTDCDTSEYLSMERSRHYSFDSD